MTYSLLVESLSKIENIEINCIVSGHRKVIECLFEFSTIKYLIASQMISFPSSSSNPGVIECDGGMAKHKSNYS